MSDAATMQATDRPMFHGLDLIRLASFIAIMQFHISLIHYYETTVPLTKESVIAAWIDVYARSISFSGFTIIFLTSLLTGISGASRPARRRLFLGLSVGWVIFSALMHQSFGWFLSWDIYPLLFFGFLLCTVLEQTSLRALRAAGVLGYAMLFIPFWDFGFLFETWPQVWLDVLGFASCDREIAEWPVLPWLGLLVGGYAVGVELRRILASGGRAVLQWHKRELYLVWLPLLALSVTQWGPFFNINLGARFSCEAYRQPPLIFWSHFIWPVFLIRASLVPTVQDFLARFRFVRWISGLAVSRKFWLAYLLHYLIAHAISWGLTTSRVEQTRWGPEVVTASTLIFLPLVEISCRAVLVVLRWVSRFGSRP